MKIHTIKTSSKISWESLNPMKLGENELLSCSNYVPLNFTSQWPMLPGSQQ